MNKKQKKIALIGGAIAGVAILFPPYLLPGSIIPDIQYGLLGHPPISNLEDYVGVKGEVFVVLLAIEVAWVGLITFVLLLAFRQPLSVSPYVREIENGALPPSDDL